MVFNFTWWRGDDKRTSAAMLGINSCAWLVGTRTLRYAVRVLKSLSSPIQKPRIKRGSRIGEERGMTSYAVNVLEASICAQ